MRILELHLWFFTGIAFILCIFNRRPAKTLRVHFKWLSDCYFRDHHPSPPLGRFCWKANIFWGALLSQHPQLSGLNRSWCQGALWHHWAAQLGKLSPSCFMREKQSMLFVLMPLSLSVRDRASLELLPSTPQSTPVNHQSQGTWQRASHLDVAFCKLSSSTHFAFAILSWALPPSSPHLASPAITLPQHQTSESTHETLSPDWDSFFYNDCSVSSSSVEPQIPNCSTSKI